MSRLVLRIFLALNVNRNNNIINNEINLTALHDLLLFVVNKNTVFTGLLFYAYTKWEDWPLSLDKRAVTYAFFICVLIGPFGSCKLRSSAKVIIMDGDWPTLDATLWCYSRASKCDVRCSGYLERVLATLTRKMFELWSLVERFRVFGWTAGPTKP